jgi:hypothetical protein
MTSRVHFPEAPGCPGAPFGPTAPPVQPRSALVVLHHLDGFLRAKFAGLLHPAAGRGVRRVSRKPAPPRSRPLATREWSALRAVANAGLAPRDASTLRRVPPVRSQYRVTAALLPPCRWVSPGTFAPCSPLLVGRSGGVSGEILDFEAFLCERVRCVRHPCGHLDQLVPSMGLCLFVVRFPSAATWDFPRATQSNPEG